MSDEKPQIDISALLPRITEEVAGELRKRMVDRFEYTVAEAVQVEVKRYIAESIIPSVQADLDKQDAALRAAVCAGVVASIEAASKALVVHAEKKIAGYDGDKVMLEMMRLLFGTRY